jgi:hypothetical protein
MTADCRSESFGPYAFTLSPAEAEAAAARAGLRLALRGGLLARHLAPLTAFALVIAFASVLALTGLISRRAGEATLILSAAAFMIQRLVSHWRVRSARQAGRAAIARLQSAGAVTAVFENDALSLNVDGRIERLFYAECEEAEDAGGLIYLWPSAGPPVVIPIRTLPGAGEAGRLVAKVRARMRGRHGAPES